MEISLSHKAACQLLDILDDFQTMDYNSFL